MSGRTVYVELVDEGVDVWRPVDALEEPGGVYRLPDISPVGETWAFAPATRVRCEWRALSGDEVLVATAPV